MKNLQKINDWYLPKNEKHLVKYIKRENGYQADCRTHALKHVRDFNLAVDVGAHIGLWAKELAEKFNIIYCFEPIENHREALRLNLKDKTNYHLAPYALGEKEALVDFDYDAENTGHTRVKEGSSGSYQVKTLDSYELPCCDFIKLDCEGYEYFALLGAKQTILKFRPIINIEQKKATYSNINQYSACELLESWGMKLLSRYKDEFVYSF